MLQLDDVVTLAIRVVVSVSVVIITKYIVPILKSWYDEKVDEKIKKVIKDAVEAAEQTIKGSGMGELKKEEVVNLVNAYLTSKGWNIDEKRLNTMIESAVFAMNLNKPKSTSTKKK